MLISSLKSKLFILGVLGLLGVTIGSTIYWVNNLPKFVVTNNKVDITNCNVPRSRYAKSICPKMFCKKQLIESGLNPSLTEIRFIKAASAGAQVGQFELGAFRYRDRGNTEIIKRFRCDLDGDKVVRIEFPEDSTLQFDTQQTHPGSFCLGPHC